MWRIVDVDPDSDTFARGSDMLLSNFDDLRFLNTQRLDGSFAGFGDGLVRDHGLTFAECEVVRDMARLVGPLTHQHRFWRSEKNFHVEPERPIPDVT
jgi:hypothetical protein